MSDFLLSLGGASQATPMPARAGVGLRFRHHDEVLNQRPACPWLEVHAENYPPRSAAADLLASLRETYPLSLHATALSLGSVERPAADALEALKALCQRLDPGLVSDHLSWSGTDGVHLPDLLPLPYTAEALEVVSRNVDIVQTALGRPILVENPSTYFSFPEAEMGEGAFLAELAARSGCGILLDINNVVVSARNADRDPGAWLDELLDQVPPARIGEIHLAGHAVEQLACGVIALIDDHGSAVSTETWSLFSHTLHRIGPRPTLIEWDRATPPFAELLAQAALAQERLDRIPADAVWS